MSQNQALRNLPVLVFSTADQQKDIRQSYRQGAWYYLIKPNCASDYARVVEDMRAFWLRQCARAYTPLDMMSVMEK
jgi:response regulator of citrate/malate metabolism